MFNKWVANGEDIKTDNNDKKEHNEKDFTEEVIQEISTKTADTKINNTEVNTILKGSKLTGDINVTCDLELSGDVEGNIKSLQNSNIVIKGTCKGNIETREGSVDIDGELRSGNIIAGNNVNIAGKFNGGEVNAKGKIYVNGEFNGKLVGNEIEIGSNAHGKGEILYKEYISISKGAKIEAQISRLQEELKAIKNSSEKKIYTPEKKVVDIKPPSNETFKVK
jgi:cytoskeletal protein CcmA (bactofilin family)